VTKFDISTLLISQVMDCQIYVTEKAIIPLFADPVTSGVAKGGRHLSPHHKSVY